MMTGPHTVTVCPQGRNDFLSGNPLRVLRILRAGLLAFGWLIVSAHYMSIATDFGRLAEVLRVFLLPALIVVGYASLLGAVVRRLNATGGDAVSRQAWSDLIAAVATLAMCGILAT